MLIFFIYFFYLLLICNISLFFSFFTFPLYFHFSSFICLFFNIFQFRCLILLYHPILLSWFRSFMCLLLYFMLPFLSSSILAPNAFIPQVFFLFFWLLFLPYTFILPKKSVTIFNSISLLFIFFISSKLFNKLFSFVYIILSF